ncbi:MAG: hypothetical protein MMC23_004682 [Stictis urceolatum]|nr:hypothetical protein [Stictis urceolata]
MAGEVAPAMSPLDMFAAQSRALARQLDEERRNDRRVSRLPPLAVSEHFSRKPGFGSTPQGQSPHSASARSAGAKDSPQREGFIPSPEEPSGNKMEIEEPAFRPKSFYPRLGKVTATPDSEAPQPPPIAEEDLFATPMEYPLQAGGDYFGGPRSRSPEPAAGRPSLDTMSQHSSQTSLSRPKQSFESVHRSTELSRGMSTDSTSSRLSQYSNSLQPPNPMFARKAASIRSVSSDDENPVITPSSSMSQHRKMSSSSGVSLPLSPQFPYNKTHNRSTSQLSEYSISNNRLSRPAFNFSRPMSRNSRPSVDSPSRMSSMDQPRVYGDEEVQTPMSSDSFMPGDTESIKDSNLANSYIYAKYALPRGRMLQRDSDPPESPPHFWSQPDPNPNAHSHPPPSPSQFPASLPTPPHSIESDHAPRTSTESLPSRPPPIPASKDSHRHSMTSMNTQNSGSTIKASAQNKNRTSAEMTPEDHLNKGIACHEKGSLNESTYHFRLAARQNNPTAMLMYALACRHGWGMRPNPTEGVTWLRKAMDCASIEMSIDEEGGRPDDTAGQKTRRAQFALSVYELGVSHMNGWGIEQDKFLALRCFEIAASWGDADAMAEAGFCFAQGIGCKKDLRKAAKFYRDAERRGMSMVGNSWIYKSKYDEPEDKERQGRSTRTDDGKKEKKRDKSRTRSIFGRKRAAA